MDRRVTTSAEGLFPIDLVERPVRRVAPGAAHVPDFLTLEQQRRLAAECRTWAGQQITSRGASLRRQVTTVPEWVTHLAREALRRGLMTAGLTLADQAPWTPDSALVTHCAPGSILRPHRIQGGGAPVVVLSVGDAGQFRLGNTESPTRPYRNILLESGDAFVYGGVARTSFVGITKIRPGTSPDWCGLTEGRIGVALTVRH